MQILIWKASATALPNRLNSTIEKYGDHNNDDQELHGNVDSAFYCAMEYILPVHANKSQRGKNQTVFFDHALNQKLASTVTKTIEIY